MCMERAESWRRWQAEYVCTHGSSSHHCCTQMVSMQATDSEAMHVPSQGSPWPVLQLVRQGF